MKDILIDFLEWIPENVLDIFEIIDNADDVVDKYIKSRDE